jgi:hypothetical protein
MGVFGAIVRRLTALTVLDPKLARRRTIRAQVVGDDSSGNEAVFLEKLRISFSAARWSRLDWTSTSSTSPSASTARQR